MIFGKIKYFLKKSAHFLFNMIKIVYNTCSAFIRKEEFYATGERIICIRLGFILISAGCAIGLGMYGDFPILRGFMAAVFCIYLCIISYYYGFTHYGHGVFCRSRKQEV